MNHLKSCDGSQPYIFISYAHANEKAVHEVLESLNQRGFRFWYDEGIEAGSEWPESIARRLAGADLVLAFVSNAYVRSDNCRKEIHFAISKGIPTVSIFLEETEMTPGVEMQLGNIFALMKYRMDDAMFYDKLYHTPQLEELSDRSAVEPQATVRPGTSAAVAVKSRNGKPRPVLRRIISTAAVLALIAAAVCAVLFVPANLSASRRMTVSREQAVEIARGLLAEQIGEEEAKDFYTDFVNRRLQYRENILVADYVYSIEFQNSIGNEIKYLVNASTGQAVLRKIDYR